MSMYTITGQLMNTFHQPIVDRETGEKRQQPKIQIMGDLPVKDTDEVRNDLVTLTVESLEPYKPLHGKTIRIPFGMFAPGKGNVVQFVPKGSKPQVVTENQMSPSKTTT